ncbi:MAG: CbiX/SirB N-terminal domain-containing protein [Acidiferrobacterales bacterium]|nr:CbiX/SirB N-terminal domain-containing protein [Acidiferrobacterales bacterium]
MKSLLVIAHGSRRQESNAEVLALRHKIAARSPSFSLIEHAFLELASPTIIEGAEKLIAAGATEILALPYFLVAGQHVVADIPNEIAKLQALHPKVSITTAPYFGASEGVVNEMLAQIESATI